MKAITYHTYGGPDVLQIEEIPKPALRKNEVLIKVHATTVTAGDARMRSFNVPKWQWLFARLYLGVFKPKRNVLGMELAGTIVETGSNVTKYKVGDNVFASTLYHNFGAYAEYKVIPEDGAIAHMPIGLSYAQAAALPIGAGTALRFLRNKIKPGHKVLIYGASGSVGTYAVQLAKHWGADVTAVCSASNAEMVKSLGADKVTDYTGIDFVKDDASYGLVFDAVGKVNMSDYRYLLKEGCMFLSVAGNPGKINADDLGQLKALSESNAIKPVIEREYVMDDIIVAHTHVDSGRKKGNVVVNLA